MLYSKLFSKTEKKEKIQESKNATLLQKAGFVDQLMAGVYSYLPLGTKVLKNIENIVREEMDNIGGQEVLLPALHPKENWEKTGRWNTMDVLFKIKESENKEMALGPTHEEVVTPLAKDNLISYKDLPTAVYQIQLKFRNELRSKSGLLRGREFLMKDMYSFNKTEKDMDEFYKKIEKAYERIWKRLGIDKITYKTYASGGDFSKYSHEYQTLCETGEDTIYLCEKCKVAINEEIIKEQIVCPGCGKKEFRKEKSIEVANIFKLKTKFSDAFDFKFIDQKGKKQPVLMGCYGIGISRLMGTLVEVFNDENGIIWPKSVSPYKVHLIGLNLEKEKVKKRAFEVYKKLQSKGIEVFFDDRDDISAGEKFSEADLIGIPLRAVVSERTGNKIEVKERTKKKGELIDFKDLIKKLN